MCFLKIQQGDLEWTAQCLAQVLMLSYAFLMGSGPFHRYVDHLRQLGFDVSGIAMAKTSRTFHLGGEHSTTSHWIAPVLVFINNSFGYVQAFIIAGETPMLLGRLIIESLRIVISGGTK